MSDVAVGWYAFPAELECCSVTPSKTVLQDAASNILEMHMK